MNRLYIATNNGDVSGGEIMLFAIARAARDLGFRVAVVAPRMPDEVCRRADTEGFEVVRLAADSRPAYILQLARFAARHRRDWFWCNGLVPSFALTGHRRKISHLHQIPRGTNKAFAAIVGVQRDVPLVPSQYAAERLPGTRAFPNWTEPVQERPRPDFPDPEAPIRIGFMGRLSQMKGTDLLADVVGRMLEAGERLELHVAGDHGHIDSTERQAVETALSRLPAASLVRHGRVRPEDFHPHVDLVVAPSDCQEIFGLVAAEAMGAGVPLVVSDDGGLPEVVGPEHPWIARAGDAEDLHRVVSEAVAALRAGDPRVHELARAARRRWEENWSPAAGFARVTVMLNERLKGVKP